ncbi:MAG: tetratricopeptide repeat protein [Magnetococcales bacterium]|nr:tetratricopeptide repeat protein [Magnetococcales bacterium]
MKLPKIIILQIFLLLTSFPLLSWGADYYQREESILDDLRSAVDTFGARHYNTVPHRLKLADFYIEEGEYYKAEPMLHQVRSLMEKRFGVGNAKLIPILKKLAALDLRQNRYSFALSQYKRAASIATRHYGSNSTKTKQIQTIIAETRRTEREWKRLGSKPAVFTETKRNRAQSSNKFSRAVFPSTSSAKQAAVNSGVAAISPIKSKPPEVKKKSFNASSSKVTVKNNVVAAVASSQSKKVQNPAKKTEHGVKTVTLPPATVASTANAPINLDSEGIPREPAAEYKKGFFISMGCFGDKKFAVGQVNRVMALNVPIYMKSIRGDSLHCVFGGPFPTRSAAQAAADLSRAKAGVEDTLVRSY